MVRRLLVALLLLAPACFKDVSPTPAEDDDGASETDVEESSSSTGVPVCGDGLVEADELCDDGNEIDGDGCTQCEWSGTVVWSKIEGTAASIIESGTDVEVDAAGRVFVAGVVAGPSTPDIWARAFDGVTGDVLWSATKHRAEDYGGGIAADGEGGAYVAGLLGGPGGAVEPWLAHYDANGASTFETIGHADMLWGAAVDVAITGDSIVTNGFRISGLNTDGVGIEYSRDGVATGREYLIDGGLTDFGWRVEAAGERVRGTAYLTTVGGVAGWNQGFAPEPSWETIIPGAVQSGSFTAMEGIQPLSIAIDGDTTFVCATVAVDTTANFQLSRIDLDGNIQWSEQHDAGATDICGGIAVDGAGDVVVVGTTASSETVASIAIAKYTANADLVWEASIEDESGSAAGVEVAMGPDGGIFVVGAVGLPDDRDIYVARLIP